MDSFKEKFEKEQIPSCIQDLFRYYYDFIQHPESQTVISEDEINPIRAQEITYYGETESYQPRGIEALPHTAILKLNGGLGTSMGLHKAKSLVPVKDDQTFLDITAGQINYFHRKFRCNTPVIFMNSFSTEEDTLEKLKEFPELKTDIPFSFVQHKFPKISQKDLQPVSYPQNPTLEWNPPGHGEIYTSLYTTGMLDTLLEKGFRYLFVSNCDNLGATLDEKILGYFAKHDFDYLMEVTIRTIADKKGGHLARKKDGSFVLRELAQCAPEDLTEFQNTKKHRYFNTNNIWIQLEHLKKKLDENKGILHLPLIKNPKTVNPRDPESEKVYQLEIAMGSAISVFPRTQLLLVPRSRFLPVKNTCDLVRMRSDRYRILDNCTIEKNPDCVHDEITLDLDKKFYGNLDDLQKHFAQGTPSLIECKSLTISGEVSFGRNISVYNDVKITNTGDNAVFIENDTKLEGSYQYH